MRSLGGRPRARSTALLAALLLLVGLFALALAPAADAADAPSGSFSISPDRDSSAGARDRSYVVRTVRPGEEFSDHVLVKNLSPRPLALELAAVDAEVTAGGAFAPVLTQGAVGSWMELATRNLTVPPRSSARVEVGFKVPVDASPGDHLGAVVVREPVGRVEGGVRVVEQVGVRVYLTVEGANARDFTVESFEYTGQRGARTFDVTVTNTGGLVVEPLGSLSLERSGLGKSTEFPVLGTVPPGETVTFPLQVEGAALEAGSYRAVVTLRPVQGGLERTATVEFEVTEEDLLTPGATEPRDGSVISATTGTAPPTPAGSLPVPLVAIALVLVALAALMLAHLVRSAPSRSRPGGE